MAVTAIEWISVFQGLKELPFPQFKVGLNVVVVVPLSIVDNWLSTAVLHCFVHSLPHGTEVHILLVP